MLFNCLVIICVFYYHQLCWTHVFSYFIWQVIADLSVSMLSAFLRWINKYVINNKHDRSGYFRGAKYNWDGIQFPELHRLLVVLNYISQNQPHVYCVFKPVMHAHWTILTQSIVCANPCQSCAFETHKPNLIILLLYVLNQVIHVESFKTNHVCVHPCLPYTLNHIKPTVCLYVTSFGVHTCAATFSFCSFLFAKHYLSWLLNPVP